MKNNFKGLKTLKSPVVTILFLILFVYVAILLYLLVWGVYSSFKTRLDFSDYPLNLPTSWTIDNYIAVMQNLDVTVSFSRTVGFFESFFYSIIYAVGSAFFATVTKLVVAYLCAMYNFRFSKFVYGIVIVTMILPIVGALPAEINMMTDLRLIDTFLGSFFMRANFLGIYFLLFYDFFKKMDKGYAEAAKLDGASDLRVLLNIAVPIASNLFFTIFLLQFVVFWNEYQVPMVFLESYPTVAYILYRFSSDPSAGILSGEPAKLAGCVLLLLPILIIFLIFNERLMTNLTVGGLKE